MSSEIVIAAQLSSVHSPEANLEPDYVFQYLEPIVKNVPLDILVLGWKERPDLFRKLTLPSSRMAKEVWLWYPFLSDYPGFEDSHLVINSNSGRSVGWGGYHNTGINETFKQACPNNPVAINTALKQMEYFLETYEFDGVFIDKIRFPSMANGLQDVFTCFCPFCMEKAANSGLDLIEIKMILNEKKFGKYAGEAIDNSSGGNWLEEITKNLPLVQQFIRFRAESMNNVIVLIEECVKRLGKKMSLDVFSPSLAPMVGQDFAFMGQHASWVKPMIYRFGNGPSSLRSEIPSLIREFGDYLGLNKEFLMRWVAGHVEGLRGMSLEDIEKVAPLSLLLAETISAVNQFPRTPVFLGLETVSIPGLMTITPRNVEEILEIGDVAAVQGYVLSWDLMHTPLENVMPLKSLKRS